MNLDNNFNSVERFSSQQFLNGDINFDLLDAMNITPAKFDQAVHSPSGDAKADWLPKVDFSDLPSLDKEAKGTVSESDVMRHFTPADILDVCTPVSTDFKFDSTDKQIDLSSDIAVKLKSFNIDPDTLVELARDLKKVDTRFDAQEISKLVEILRDGKEVQKLNEYSKEDSAHSADQYLKKHPELVKQIEAHFKVERDNLNGQHQHLSEWADRNLQEPDRSKFKKDVADFQTRSQRDGLSPKEIADTYKEISRLTDAKGNQPLSPLERKHLVQQVMHQAAVPTSIDQGKHNTCNVSTVEARTYARNPADAARLVADVALTGQYRAGDGTIVNVDPHPHDESRRWPTPNGSRSHASEIFQITAINVHYVKENAVTGENIRYEQVEPKKGDKGDHGERLMDYSTTPPVEIGREPGLHDGALSEISNAISGKQEKDVIIAADNYVYGDKKDVTTVNSKEELAAKLKYLKDHHQLPAIIRVNTQLEPFFSDSGAGSAGGSGGAHVVTVTDYDSKTGNVCIDNQWGKQWDHGKDKPVSLHDLYTAMQSNEDAEAQLEIDVKWNRDHGTVDRFKEMELLRMRYSNETISDADYDKEVQKIIQETSNRWNSGKVSSSERMAECKEISNLIHALPPKDQIHLLRQSHKAHIFDDASYRMELEVAGWKIHQEHRDNSKIIDGQSEIDFTIGQYELKKALSELPIAYQKSILQNIARMTN